MEGSHRGLVRRIANPLYRRKAVPWVQIPPPPISKVYSEHILNTLFRAHSLHFLKVY